MSQLTEVAVFRAGGGADLEVAADERPALKRELIEMWIAERNAFAETVVKDMRKQERAARAKPKPAVETRVPVLAR